MNGTSEIPEAPETQQEAVPGGKITSDDKLWALLAYILSPIVPLILMFWEDKKNRPFIREHNAQALVLGIINFVLTIVGGASIILACLPLFVWLYMLYLGIHAYQGKSVTIPVITNFVKSQGWA